MSNWRKEGKLKETKTLKKIEEKNTNGERIKKEWKESDSVPRHRSDFTTVTENHVEANYGDMKKWKKFHSFGRTSIDIGIIIPAIIQCDIVEIINTYTVLHFEISLMIFNCNGVWRWKTIRTFRRTSWRKRIFYKVSSTTPCPNVIHLQGHTVAISYIIRV